MGVGGRISVVVVAAAVGAFALLASPAFASFPGANGKIVFTGPDTSRADLFTINPDGTDLTPLTNTFSEDEFQAAWSPDGSRVAFLVGRDIWVMDADGTGRTRVTSGSERFGEGDQNPSWSPDGSRIVFSRDLDFPAAVCQDTFFEPCGKEIFTVNSDGSGLTQITNDTFADLDPAWSPDGERIAFTRRLGCPGPPGGQPVCSVDVYVMNADGTGQTAITPSGPTFDADPSWSPDGRRIAIYSNRHFCCGGAAWEIYTMNSDGTDARRITFSGLSTLPFLIAIEPSWSPDGSRIAFTYLLAGSDNDIFTVAPDGSGLARLEDGGMISYEPDWQPLNRTPDCSNVSADPSLLLPANRKFITVFLSGATDPDGDVVALTIDGVTQDEPVTTSGDPTSPDAAEGAAPHSVNLRAERNPKGDGRVYRVAFTASDGRGGACSGTAKVSVPRHKDDPAVDSAPPSFDSFGS
jgi:Tol biopolymer transport system component